MILTNKKKRMKLKSLRRTALMDSLVRSNQESVLDPPPNLILPLNNSRFLLTWSLNDVFLIYHYHYYRTFTYSSAKLFTFLKLYLSLFFSSRSGRLSNLANYELKNLHKFIAPYLFREPFLSWDNSCNGPSWMKTRKIQFSLKRCLTHKTFRVSFIFPPVKLYQFQNENNSFASLWNEVIFLINFY